MEFYFHITLYVYAFYMVVLTNFYNRPVQSHLKKNLQEYFNSVSSFLKSKTLTMTMNSLLYWIPSVIRNVVRFWNILWEIYKLFQLKRYLELVDFTDFRRDLETHFALTHRVAPFSSLCFKDDEFFHFQVKGFVPQTPLTGKQWLNGKNEW